MIHVCFLLSAAVAWADDRPLDPNAAPDEKLAAVQKLLADPLLDLSALPASMSLEKLLDAVEHQLPAGKKLTVRLDTAALGKELPKLAAMEISPHFGRGKRSLHTALRIVLRQVEGRPLDYAIRPEGIVITRRHLAAHWAVHEVGGVLEEMPLLLPLLKKEHHGRYEDLDPADGAALLARLLAMEANLQPWETLEVRNRARVAVLASPERQEEVAELLEALQRQLSTAVVMNARLYEVERTFFSKEVAPLFARDKDAAEKPALVSIDEKLFRKIRKQPSLLESDFVKLRPGGEVPFLSRHTLFRFTASAGPGKTRPSTGLSGVSFRVRPFVSPDRRSLRLEIAQQVTQLVRIDRAKILDPATGKDVEFDAPNVRKHSTKGAVQLPDSGGLLMAVDYRPPGKPGEDKVWLLVARPFIWIEEEVKEIRKGGGDLTPRSIWESRVPEAEDSEPNPNSGE
jgi:hypothetical protein